MTLSANVPQKDLSFNINSFTHYYFAHPLNDNLSKKAKFAALMLTVSLAIFTLGIFPVICRIAFFEKNFTVITKPSKTDEKTKDVADRVIEKKPKDKDIDPTADYKPEVKKDSKADDTIEPEVKDEASQADDKPEVSKESQLPKSIPIPELSAEEIKNMEANRWDIQEGKAYTLENQLLKSKTKDLAADLDILPTLEDLDFLRNPLPKNTDTQSEEKSSFEPEVLPYNDTTSVLTDTAKTTPKKESKKTDKTSKPSTPSAKKLSFIQNFKQVAGEALQASNIDGLKTIGTKVLESIGTST